MQTIVETPEFIKRAKVILSDQERQDFINFIAQNPKSGVSLGGGLYKIRYARTGQGKSGGFRIIYLFSDRDIPLFLLTIFGKNEKSNLSRSEQNDLIILAKQIIDLYRRKFQ